MRGTHENMERLIGLLGIVALLAIAVLFSSNRRWIRLRVVVPAFLLQAGFAVLVIGTPWGRAVIQAMSNGVSNLLSYADEGTRFLFGDVLTQAIAVGSVAIYSATGTAVVLFLVHVLVGLRVEADSEVWNAQYAACRIVHHRPDD